jgi:hypothetical protein
MEQFIPHGEGNKDVIKEFSEGFTAIDQNQIMEGPSVGDDDAAHLFGNASETFEV